MKRTLFLVTFSLMLGLLSAQTNRFVGGDLSLLPAYEKANTPYYTPTGGTIKDLVTYAKAAYRWNSIRVRLFVNPVIINADSTRQGEVQDLEYVTALGKRIKDAGLNFMLDFHYSDSWADPSKQTIPGAWLALSKAQLVDTVYGYTRACLQHLVAAGATPDFVQIGNETSYGMLWKSKGNDMVSPNASYDTYKNNWQQLARYYNAGARAVREICPQAKVVIHIERTAVPSQCVNYYKYLAKDSVDYDIIGLSYYPFWHQDLSVLENTLVSLSSNFPDKDIQIVETAWYNNYYPTKGVYDYTSTWPASAAGQVKYLQDLIACLRKYPKVNGLYYWFPEENGCGGASWSADNIVIDNWINRGLFDPNTHKAYTGSNQLKAFLEPPIVTAISQDDMPSRPTKLFENGRLIIQHGSSKFAVDGTKL